MQGFNSENERVKNKYFKELKNAKGKADSTIQNIRYSINLFEIFTNHQNFKTYNKDKGINFKEFLSEKTGKNYQKLSLPTKVNHLKNVKKFLIEISKYPGYKSKMSINDIDHLNPSDKELRSTQGIKYKDFPTSEQIKHVISNLPSNTETEKRNRALIAFTYLSGMRDGAIASLSLKHIDLQKELINQSAKEVKTKFGKNITTFFFPVCEEIIVIFVDWVNFLYNEKQFSDSDPVFPRNKVDLDKDNLFTSTELEPVHWQSSSSIRKIFKKSFEQFNFKYYNPHSFRNTLVNLGEKICKTPEEFKAWSQNLGHNQVLTTFTSYGYVNCHRQGEIIKGFKNNKESINLDSLKKELKQHIKEDKFEMFWDFFELVKNN